MTRQAITPNQYNAREFLRDNIQLARDGYVEIQRTKEGDVLVGIEDESAKGVDQKDARTFVSYLQQKGFQKSDVLFAIKHADLTEDEQRKLEAAVKLEHFPEAPEQRPSK